MIKKPVTKLKITKNKRIADKDNMFTYMFEWINGYTLVWKEILKIQADQMMLPVETYNLDDIISHKISCCMTIDPATLEIETIEL
jgi:hypothetical protein